MIFSDLGEPGCGAGRGRLERICEAFWALLRPFRRRPWEVLGLRRGHLGDIGSVRAGYAAVLRRLSPLRAEVQKCIFFIRKVMILQLPGVRRVVSTFAVEVVRRRFKRQQ